MNSNPLKTSTSRAPICAKPNNRVNYVSHQRKSTVVAAVDPASAEIIATLTAVAASSATVLGLAKIIRSANGFDKQQSPIVLETVQQTVESITEIQEEKPVIEDIKPAAEPVAQPIAAAYVDNSAAVAQVQNWIANWKNKSSTPEPEITVAVAEEKTVVYDNSAAVAEVQKWIENWKNKPTPVVATSTPTTTTKADPAAAAAVLTAMTADTPVGATASTTETQSTPQVDQQQPVLATVGAPTTTSSQDDTTALQVESQPQQTQRVVTISDSHIEKVSAMWASFKEQTEKKAQLLAKQEKLTLDLAALEQVEKESKKKESTTIGEKKQGAVVSFVQRILAFFMNVWAMIVQFVSGVYQGRFGGSSA